MKIIHIDNSFFRLSVGQAKALSIDGELPRDGYEKRADPSKFSTLELLTHDGRPCQAKAIHAQAGWIKRTRTNGETVWAIHLHFSVNSPFVSKY